jgi:hypothetical protein
MLLKEVCNLLATVWKIARLKISNMQVSLIIEVETRYSQIHVAVYIIKRAQVRCQNMDK